MKNNIKQFGTVMFASAILCTIAFAQQFQIPITVSIDSPAKSQTVTIGVRAGNTSGLDDASSFGGYRETPLAPKPPTPDFEVRLTTPVASGTHKDFRNFTASNQTDSYTLELHGSDFDNLTGTVTISWPAAAVLNAYGTSWTIDDGASGALFTSNFDMTSASSVTFTTQLSGAQVITITKIGAAQPVTVSENVVPKYFGGKTGTSVHNARTPFAVQLGFAGLSASTAYDLKVGVGLTTEQSNVYGGGTVWNGSAFSGQTVTNAFTTDGSGNGSAWVFIQPGADADRFEIGGVHNLRVGYVANGGSMPSSPSYIAFITSTALDLGTTDRTPGVLTDNGAFVISNVLASLSGKYIVLFDNTAGTGQPIYATQARTATATNGSQSELPASVNQIWNQSGGDANGWAAVLPVTSISANGLRRIEARNTDNSLNNSATSADGIWSSVATGTLTRTGVANITDAAPLPVELVSFSAASTGMNISLKWNTATEVDNAGFGVERKRSSATEWSEAAFIQGAGTSNAVHEYSFQEILTQAGQYSYRLKQVDRNGAVSYSAAVEVTVGAAPKEFSLSKNYPNPFNPSTKFNFTVPTTGNVSVKVFNILGQQVASLFDGIAEAGIYNTVDFNASSLSSGIYFARVEFNGKSLMQKMMLMK